jgi:hypothetical protein
MKLRGLTYLGGLGDGLASGNSACFICFRLVDLLMWSALLIVSVIYIYTGLSLFSSVKEQNILDRCLNLVH